MNKKLVILGLVGSTLIGSLSYVKVFSNKAVFRRNTRNYERITFEELTSSVRNDGRGFVFLADPDCSTCRDFSKDLRSVGTFSDFSVLEVRRKEGITKQDLNFLSNEWGIRSATFPQLVYYNGNTRKVLDTNEWEKYGAVVISDFLKN